MKLKDSFHPYALITILCWSMAYVFTRLAAPYLSPYAIGFLRIASAAAVLAVLAVPLKLKLPARADLPWFILSGAVGFFGYIIAFNKGCEVLSAATSSVIIATTPVITALLALFIYKERLRAYQWAAIAVEFVGVAVLTVMASGVSVNTGILWLVGAAVVLSIYNLLQRRLTKTYSAAQASAYSIFMGTIMLAVFLPHTVGEVQNAPASSIFYVVIMGILCTGLAYIAWAKAFAKAAKTSQVSNYMFLTPFLTSILGVIMVGEVPDGATLAGGAIILAGVVLFNFGGAVFGQARCGDEIMHS